MARNKLSDLNNHLFAQLERLNEEGISQEELKSEIERSKAIAVISKNIIENAKTTLQGIKVVQNEISKGQAVPDQFKISQ